VPCEEVAGLGRVPGEAERVEASERLFEKVGVLADPAEGAPAIHRTGTVE
jgi:hypothetical protein